jgi:hypothetical protein
MYNVRLYRIVTLNPLYNGKNKAKIHLLFKVVPTVFVFSFGAGD